MSIIPASRLSSSDLALLGNNVVPARRASRSRERKQSASRQILAAVQRSLASVGEADTEFYPAITTAGGRRGL